MARAASVLSPTTRMISPIRVAAEHPPHQHRENRAHEEQHVDLQRGLDLRHVGPPAEIDRRQVRRHRLDEGLAEEEGEAHAEQHQRDADRDVVDPGQRADAARARGRKPRPEAAAAATPIQASPVR